MRLDGGSFFTLGVAEAASINRWMLEGTYRSRLDALNLTAWDLPAWQEMWDLAAAGQLPRQFLDLPLVSANVKAKAPNFPALRKFVFKELVVDPKSGTKLRVGISGVLFDPEERISREEFNVKDPQEAVRQVVAEMEPGSDYRIIMIDAGVGKAISLAAVVPGINLIIVAHNYEEILEPQQVGDTLISVPANEGRLISEVRVSFQQGSQSLGVHTRFVPLDRSVPDDPEMSALIRKAQADVDEFKRAR